MDVERTIEFLLDQQARLSLRVDEVQQSQLKVHELIRRIMTMMDRMMKSMEGVGNIQEMYNRLLFSLCEAERKTEEHIGRLADTQRRTLEQFQRVLDEHSIRLQSAPEGEPEEGKKEERPETAR